MKTLNVAGAKHIFFITACLLTVVGQAQQLNVQPIPIELIVHPEAGTIISEKYNEALDAVELTLSNGAKVILKRTIFKDNEIIFGAVSSGGLSTAEKAIFHSAQYSTSLIYFSGIGDFTRAQLRRLSVGKVRAPYPYVDLYDEGIEGKAISGEIETFMKLLYLQFTAPRIDTVIVNKTKTELEKSVKAKYDSPFDALQDTIDQIVNNGNFSNMALTESDVKNINQNDALSFYKDRFSDASAFTFLFVGDFDIDKIKPLIEKYISSLPSKYRKESLKNIVSKPIDRNISKTIYQGSKDNAEVSLTYHGLYNFSSVTSLELTALKFLLLNKLTAMREQEDDISDIDVIVRQDLLPTPAYRIELTFSCAPANVDKLIASLEGEVQQLKKSVSYGNLNKFILEEQWLMEFAANDNEVWIRYLKDVVRGQKSQDYFINFSSRLKGLTTDELKAAANKYLRSENMAKVILMPKKDN